jgi:protocatechuate 3,4-dioxygenase beta subunit
MKHTLLSAVASLLMIGALNGPSYTQDAPAGLSALRGIVTNQVSGEPVPLAEVRLIVQGASTVSVIVLADESGHFQFDDLAPGNYSLSANRPEFASGQPVELSIGPGPTSRNLQLAPLGVIAGRVYANDGDTLSGVTVTALRVTRSQGKIVLSHAAKTTTDDLGAYRLHALRPGRYCVKINVQGGASQVDDDSSKPVSSGIFYPSATSQDAAIALDIAAGSVQTGIDFSLPDTRTAAVLRTPRLSESESGAIQGDVLNADTGNPVQNAKVSLLEGDGTVGETPSTRSNASGSFSFQGVPPGTYRLTASRSGYLAPSSAVPESSSSERDVTVAAGQTLDDAVLRLVPLGVITGSVLDGAVPISNAIVMATHFSFSAGEKKMVLAARTYTNDLGEYRLFDLPPGHYYLSVTYRGGVAPGSPEPDRAIRVQGNSRQKEYVTTFYPNTKDFSEAVPLEIAPGRMQVSIDLALLKMYKWTVEGKVLLPQNARITGSPQVVFVPGNSSFLIPKFNQQTASVNSRTGAFEIDGVPSGDYTLSVDAQVGGVSYAASQKIFVAEANVDGLVVALGHLFSIPGRVTVNGSDQCDLTGLSVNAKSSGGQGTAHGARASVNADGSFLLKNLHPDNYHLRLEGVVGNCYQKSITLGMSDVTSTYVQLVQGTPPIEFVLCADGGKIDGDVIDDQHQPVASATVVLIPEPSLRDQSELYKKTTTDQSGQFTLQGIPPGDYKLFAWEAIDSDSYLDPDVLAPFESLGQSVSIQAGSQSNMELMVIARGGI